MDLLKLKKIFFLQKYKGHNISKEKKIYTFKIYL
jgi:hypothetical protein